MSDWMQTASGLAYYPCEPRWSDVRIGDIAASLSKLCRFAGHCASFYSVAEHSVLVSHVVPREYALQGLLHDATEAYCVDVPRPLKRSLPEYQRIEHLNWLAVAKAFGLPEELHESVHEADNAVLLAERDALFTAGPAAWSLPGKPAKVRIACWRPTRAEAEFLQRFEELTQ